jgi:hypothetical protein
MYIHIKHIPLMNTHTQIVMIKFDEAVKAYTVQQALEVQRKVVIYMHVCVYACIFVTRVFISTSQSALGVLFLFEIVSVFRNQVYPRMNP